MKKYAVLALAVASILTVGSAVAEPFNERGKDFIGNVETSSHTERQLLPVRAASYRRFQMDLASIDSFTFSDQ